MKLISRSFSAALILILGFSYSSFAQEPHMNYPGWTGFEYVTVGHDGYLNSEVHELLKDYTISLPEYFLDQEKMPSKRFLGDSSYRSADWYRVWAEDLKTIDSNFIRLESGGILTIKRGYRWDGHTRPCKFWTGCVDEYSDFRSTVVHDALYDLMRMRNLTPDTRPWLMVCPLWPASGIDPCLNDKTGDRNRQMADMIWYMIAVEDGLPKSDAQNDYEAIRVGGACRSSDDYGEMMRPWKYHVSELTAYSVDGTVELEWKSADEAAGERNGYHIYRDDNPVKDFSGDTTSWVDSNPGEKGKQFTYQIDQGEGEADWSNKDVVVPVSGPGNSLRLGYDNDRQYVVSTTASYDLGQSKDSTYGPDEATFEAWVYPEENQKSSSSSILNFGRGGKSFELLYCGSEQKFCYRAYPAGANVSSADTFPPNHWYHIAVALDKRNAIGSLYVNGTQQAVFTVDELPIMGYQFSIGGGPRANGGYFKGKIDEARIWKVTRNQTEIQTDMCGPLRGHQTGLVGLWHFNNPANISNLNCPESNPLWGCITYDATVNSNDGFLNQAKYSKPYVPSDAMFSKPATRDITVLLDADGNAYIRPEHVYRGSLDNFCMESISVFPNSFTCQDIGSNEVTLTVTNINGDVSTANAIVTVVDNMPPDISEMTVIPETLWPPNHKMRRAEISAVSITDNCDPVGLDQCRISSVISSDGEGDADIQIKGDLKVDLRAERSPAGDERVYTITNECWDQSENTSEATGEVIVPHDQRK